MKIIINPELREEIESLVAPEDVDICLQFLVNYELNLPKPELSQDLTLDAVCALDKVPTVFVSNDINEDKWNWVSTEYIALFEAIGKRPHKRETLSRMKNLFKNNPDIRKDEIIAATEMYLDATNPKYVRFPHYFISKGVGNNKTEDILTWIELYREQNSGESNILR